MGAVIPDEVRIVDSSEWPRPKTYPLKVVWLKRLGRERRWLKRISRSETCANDQWHWGSIWIGDAVSTIKTELEGDSTGDWPLDDPRWPTKCDKCGRAFTAEDDYRYERVRLYSYKGPYGHLVVTTRNAPPGSLYNAVWLDGHPWGVGPDGIALHAVCPNGRHWHVDGQASNCTMPQDRGKKFVRTHYCWVRHGDPKLPYTLHVDKNGRTCAAGAGSIVAGDYHGFLHNGGFTAG